MGIYIPVLKYIVVVVPSANVLQVQSAETAHFTPPLYSGFFLPELSILLSLGGVTHTHTHTHTWCVQVITNIDVQSIEPVDQHMRDSLSKSVQMAIEISTKLAHHPRCITMLSSC